ncbi:penicillin acylase family protein [Thermogymnomonas acidicola]|uniref:penicillin acylase family protein n=1 Tax=Thermogymnomonas acidicola TaxID=399579 RepID=UPI0009461FD1|nr:penicillin acylase family protein [Thermogymnomonas acidicola]
MSFSPGFRAQLEVDYLEDHTELTLRDMMTLQSENFTDTQAELLLPHIEANLSSSMNASVEDALSILSGWNYSMEPSSKAASVWFFSYMYIFNDTFSHIFEDYGIYPAYRSVLNVSGMGGSFLNTIGIPSLGLALTEMLITGHGLPGLGDERDAGRGAGSGAGHALPLQHVPGWELHLVPLLRLPVPPQHPRH